MKKQEEKKLSIESTIFKELSILLDKLKLTDLSNLLKQYDSLSDKEEFLDLIVGMNNSVEQIEESSEERKVYNWVDIKGNMLPVHCIYSIQQSEYYDISKAIKVYQILINKDVQTKNTLIKDITVNCDSKQERDKIIEDLRVKFYQLNIQFI